MINCRITLQSLYGISVDGSKIQKLLARSVQYFFFQEFNRKARDVFEVVNGPWVRLAVADLFSIYFIVSSKTLYFVFLQTIFSTRERVRSSTGFIHANVSHHPQFLSNRLIIFFYLSEFMHVRSQWATSLN